MSDLENPYQSPETPIIPETSQDTGISFSVTMLQYLNEASPWLRFVGILGYVGCGTMVVIGIVAAIAMSALSGFVDDFGDFPAWIFSLIYIPFGALMFFPAHFTYKFGKKIRDYKFSNSIEDIELALKNNKSLWKFYGILCIIYLAIIPLFFVLAIVGGVVALISGL
jgi:thiosulfate reductase cytochrome b subunit